jgi:Tfp pilus assembly protein PilX
MTGSIRQSGAALLTALFATAAVMVVAVSAAQTAVNAEKLIRNERDRQLAFQSAEAALNDAERDIAGGADPGSARAALFASGDASRFIEGCGRAEGSIEFGLCRFVPSGSAPAWQAADLDAGAPYGAFTGATLPGRLPRYVIELVPPPEPGAGHLYRITAIGFGVRPDTQIVLQSFYRKNGTANLRVSWREVANWQELHDAAK